MIFAIDLNPLDDIIDGVGGLIGGAAEAAGEAVLDLVVKFTFGLIADAVASITGSIVSAMDSSTCPRPCSSWSCLSRCLDIDTHRRRGLARRDG